MTLTRVYEPIQVGNVEIPNRIVRAAHGTGLSSPQNLLGGEDLVAYHVARARGGVGLSILEATAVHSSSHSLTMSEDAVVGRYRELADAVRPHGMRLFQQIFHAANNAFPVAGGLPWAASTVPAPTGVVGVPMTIAQIEEVIDGYAAAARRCREGGLDGVEVHSAHSYLPHHFLSPILNTRSDRYGGSLENRMRFLQETLRAVRVAVGEDFVVGVRLGASQLPGSIREEELRAVIRALQEEGLIDYLTTTLGDYYRIATISATMERPVGYELPSARQLTEVAEVPSIVTGRFRTLAEAERVLADGVADMVSMVRALIADPDIVSKTRAGRAAEVRPCIACNQACQGGLFLPPPRLGCVVNPAVGFERTLSEDLIEPAASPLDVHVVGGGPAGLEAARVAALAGHRVTLVEASSSLGGAVRSARRGPNSAPLGDIADWLAAAVQRAGVEIRLGSAATADDIAAADPDVTIVAAGSTPRLDGIQPLRPQEPPAGADRPHVRSSVALLGGDLPDGARTALVLDATGHFEAITSAEYLVQRGLAVTYVTTLPSFGGPIVQATARDVPALEYLEAGEFRLLVGHQLLEIGAASCVVRPLHGERTAEAPADVVVLVTPNRPNRELHDELAAAGRDGVHLIGDAASPRDLQAAIAEGHRVARALAQAPAAAAAGAPGGGP